LEARSGGFDPVAGQMKPNPGVLIQGDTVKAIGGAVPAAARVIDAKGKYLIPGLIDSHAHVTFVPDDAGIDPQTLLPLYLKAGVTTLRDLGGDPPHRCRCAKNA
jgi:imidazolonepropionase-like amidohydrolase